MGKEWVGRAGFQNGKAGFKTEDRRYFWLERGAIGVDLQSAEAEASCCGVNLAWRQRDFALDVVQYFRLGDDGDQLDFNQCVFGESGHLDGGAGRRGHALRHEVLAIDGVHRGKVVHVFQEYDGFDDMCEIGSGGSQDRLQVFKYARGLFGDSAGDDLTGGRIESDLAGSVQQVAGADCLRIGANGSRGVRSRDRGLVRIRHGSIVLGLRLGGKEGTPVMTRNQGCPFR